MPVEIPSVGETAVVGAAILAAAGVGAVADLEAGVAAMTVGRRPGIEPRSRRSRARYDELYACTGPWPAIAPTVHALGERRPHPRASRGAVVECADAARW